MTDQTGSTTAFNTYDEYGIPSLTNLGRWQYTGQAWIPEIGLYHYKARAYSPTLGRFMQTDPVGYQDDRNLYAYVGGDPVNASDPSGLINALSGVTVTAPCDADCEARRQKAAEDMQRRALYDQINRYLRQPPPRAPTRQPQNNGGRCTVVKRGSTGQIGLAGQGTIGPVSFQISVGVAFDSSANVALYGTAGPGAGAGGGGAAGLTLQTSNAPTVTDLGGPFGNVSGGGGLIGGGTVDGFVGTARNGQPVVGGGATGGAAGGETSFGGITNTAVSPPLNLLGKPTC